MRSLLIAAGVTALVTAAVACDSDGTGDSPTGPSNTETITIVANSGSQSFSPNPASAGGRMTEWRNSHAQTHRIVANDGSFDTGDIPPGSTSTPMPLPAAGTNYHCSIHPTMIGAVGGAGGAAPPPCVGDYCD